jgi:hypothetical protein
MMTADWCDRSAGIRSTINRFKTIVNDLNLHIFKICCIRTNVILSEKNALNYRTCTDKTIMCYFRVICTMSDYNEILQQKISSS